MTGQPDDGSRIEATAAVLHHLHHPVDPNVGVVRGRTGRGALLAATVSAVVTVVGIVFLALAVRGGA